jgi:hypothetical protein
MTLTKNQISAAKPMNGNNHLAQRHWRFKPTTRPVLPQMSNKPFLIGMSFFKIFASQTRASPADTQFRLNQIDASAPTFLGKEATLVARPFGDTKRGWNMAGRRWQSAPASHSRFGEARRQRIQSKFVFAISK